MSPVFTEKHCEEWLRPFRFTYEFSHKYRLSGEWHIFYISKTEGNKVCIEFIKEDTAPHLTFSCFLINKDGESISGLQYFTNRTNASIDLFEHKVDYLETCLLNNVTALSFIQGEEVLITPSFIQPFMGIFLYETDTEYCFLCEDMSPQFLTKGNHWRYEKTGDITELSQELLTKKEEIVKTPDISIQGVKWSELWETNPEIFPTFQNHLQRNSHLL